MLEIKPVARSDVIAIICPKCRQRLPHTALMRGSRVSGLTFKCPKCKSFFELRAYPDKNTDRR